MRGEIRKLSDSHQSHITRAAPRTSQSQDQLRRPCRAPAATAAATEGTKDWAGQCGLVSVLTLTLSLSFSQQTILTHLKT